MSYSTFKRVFGESSLERKCRWWFGISLGLLIFLSFYFYGSYAKKLIYEQNRELGKQLVRTAYSEAHRGVDPLVMKAEQAAASDNSKAGAAAANTTEGANWYREILDEGRRYGTEFRWDTVLPPNPENINPPQGRTEAELMEKYIQFVLPPEQSRDAKSAEETSPTEVDLDVDSDDYLPEGVQPFDRVAPVNGHKTYQYYYPLYARASCVGCHKYLGNPPRKTLKEGELLAIMRISFDHGPTASKLAKGEAILWTAAIVTGFLSMLMLWAVVRYVIVKPRAAPPRRERRDQPTATSTQRAEIHTGDEFEELGRRVQPHGPPPGAVQETNCAK